MERNYKSIEVRGYWYIEYEYYNNQLEKWLTSLFTDLLGEKLCFLRKEDADNFIKYRKEILKIEPF